MPEEFAADAIAGYGSYYDARAIFCDPPDPDHALIGEVLTKPQKSFIVGLLEEHEALPPPLIGIVPLGAGEPVELEPFEDPLHPRRADRELVVAAEIHRDLLRSEVVVLAEVGDLSRHLGGGGVGTDVGPREAVSEPL